MSNKEVEVNIEPQGRQVYVLPGTKVLEAAARAGVACNTPCGGQGTCGKCRVKFTKGTPEPGAVEKQLLSEKELQDGIRLSCQARVESPATIEIPEETLFAGYHQILSDFGGKADLAPEPAVRTQYVELPEPTLADDAADLARLTQAAGNLKTDLETLKKLPDLLREGQFKGTAVITDRHLIDFESGNTEDQCYGVAFDLGTTTLAASLIHLCRGRELGIVSRMNPQISYGDDVLSRILYAGQCPDCLQELHRSIVGTMSEMIRDLARAAGVSSTHIYEVTVAGNTTMQHLFCGLDPKTLGEIPFVPIHSRGLLLPVENFQLPIHHHGSVYLFPAIGGFVGGDTSAGMLVTHLDRQEGPVLLVDIGTNGEIVLSHEGKLHAASTAAGPAFEGARIAHGMRASTGAIEKVMIESEHLRLNVIGNVPATGICGSGLIDAAAALIRSGILQSTGRLLGPDDSPDNLSDDLRRRIICPDTEPEFILAHAEQTRSGIPVVLTQRDLRELQLATGAIRAGITLLLDKVSLKPEQLREVLIAGGFGNFIRRSNAQQLGLFPAEVPRERIRFLGNTSLAGARWGLISKSARRRAEELAEKTEHLNLSENPNFQMAFAEAMIFPESKNP